MATGVTCEVSTDMGPVQDGSGVLDPVAPIALSGLALTWGRDTTVDQPDASTCTFEVADPPGGAAFGDVFRVGTPIRVTATGEIFPDPTVSTFVDPGFEAAAPNATGLVRGTVTRSSRRGHAGAWSARLDCTGTESASVVLAPAPFVPVDTSPDAWDAIPQAGAGQRWSFGASVFAPAGATVVLHPVLFSGPYAGAWIPERLRITIVGDDAWHTVSTSYVPTFTNRWIGVQVVVSPTGPTWDQLPPTQTWNAVPADWQWADYGAVFVDDVLVLAPAGGVDQTVLVYAGRVTDLAAAYDESIPAPVARVTCADFTADLDNVDVGDSPWVAEPMSTRFNRVLAASGLPVTATIDTSAGALQVSWRDVDRQPAMGLLRELGVTVDAVVWSAVHAVTGAYLDVEDPANRAPSKELALIGGLVTIVDSTATAGALALSACDVLRDPVGWDESVSDVATRVSVDYLTQGTDPGPPVTPTTTQANITVIDSNREGYGVGRFGTRRYGVSTQLTTSTDAAAVAERILARTTLVWRASGITLEDGASASSIDPVVAVQRMLTLLDGTSRNGLLLRLTDLPAWAPDAPSVGVYLEGGTYTFEDGRWTLALNVSNARYGGASAQWDQLDPTWTWAQVDPAITWDDLLGVGP